MPGFPMALAVLLPFAAAAMPAPAAQVEARAEAVPAARAEGAAGVAARDPAMPTPADTVASGAYALQPPGEFHGGEAVARDGEHWLALRMDQRDAALVPATLRVQAIADPVHDAAGGRSGQAVSSGAPDEALRMYLRGPALVAGLLDEASLSMHDNDGRHRIDHVLVFRGRRHRLRSECTPLAAAPVDGQRGFDCAIVLHDPRGRSQVLARMGGYATSPGEHAWLGDDAAPGVLFAGDLDRDGELDLLLDTTSHYNVSRPTLFLSSQAAPGELLGKAAEFESVGC